MTTPTSSQGCAVLAAGPRRPGVARWNVVRRVPVTDEPGTRTPRAGSTSTWSAAGVGAPAGGSPVSPILLQGIGTPSTVTSRTAGPTGPSAVSGWSAASV